MASQQTFLGKYTPRCQTVASYLHVDAASSILGLLKPLHSRLQIDVGELGKAVVNAGWFGSAKLPKDVNATTVQADGGSFTLIGNAGALNLAKHTRS
jgi:hypothetical protein